MHELEKGMDQVRKEFELRGKEKHNTVLRDFLNNSEEKLRRLKSDARTAGEAFRECVEFFGESPRQADANTFFSLLVRFARAFKVVILSNWIICLISSKYFSNFALQKFRYDFLNNFQINNFKYHAFFVQAADQENEQRRRLEAAAAEALNTSEEVIKRNKLNQKKQQVRVNFRFFIIFFWWILFLPFVIFM